MEAKNLVNSKETLENAAYGAVNPCCEEGKSKDCSSETPRIESSFEAKMKGVPRSRSCSCTVQVGECDCGIKKRSVQLEPWARYKTIVMAVGLSLFGVWIIIISVIGRQGKL